MSDDRAQLRARFPVPADRDLPPGRHLLHRENLMNQILNEPPGMPPVHDETPPRSRRPLSWRLSAPLPSARGLIAIAAAVALVAGLGVTVADRLSTHATSSSQPSAAMAPGTAAVLLDQIAKAAAAQPAAKVGPNQYFYVKVKITGGGGPDHVVEEWIPQGLKQPSLLKYDDRPATANEPFPAGTTFNAIAPMTRMSIGEPDQFRNPSYAYLRSLPTNPRQLLHYIEKQLHTVYTVPDVSILAFYMIGDLLLGAVVPPQTAAALYRAAALIPGVTVVPDVTDTLGRHGIGITSPPTGAPGPVEWMFSKTTHQLIGVGVAIGETYVSTGKAVPPLLSAVLAKGVADTLGGAPTLIR